jgi:hypothetical protein
MSDAIHFDVAVLRRPAPTDGRKLAKFLLNAGLSEPTAREHLGKRPVFFVLRARNLELWVVPSRSPIDEMARAVAAQGKTPQAVGLFSVGIDGPTQTPFFDLMVERRGKRYQAARLDPSDPKTETFDHGEVPEAQRWIGVPSQIRIEAVPFSTPEN